MLRKLVGCILIIVILVASSLTAFAAPVESSDKSASVTAGENKETAKDTPDYKDLLNYAIKEGAPTSEFLVNITKPSSESEVVTYKSYNICGTTKKSDIKVLFARKNEETGKYQLIANADGDTSWQGNSQFFSNDIGLLEGSNKIKIVAYRTTQEDDLKQEDIQVTTFTITYVEKTFFDKAIDIFNSIFAPKSK